MVRFQALLACLILVRTLAAQVDSLWLDIPETLLEELENSAGEEVSDLEQRFGELAALRHAPLHLNRATAEALRVSGLLSDRQISELLRYREQLGPLLSLYELQAVPAFDLASIRRLLPFVTLDDRLDQFQVPFLKMLTGGKSELFLRWSRYYERESSPAGFEGSADQLFLRFGHSYAGRLSWGLTAEKDRGEAWFRGSNPQGFDYYSFHFFLRHYSKRLRALAIGDYRVSLGQGLLLFGGYAFGKGAATTTIRRPGRTLYAHRSTDETNFLRGIAATVALGSRFELTAFLSRRRRDGNLLAADSSFSVPVVSSLQTSGLHRSAAEIADEGALSMLAAGARLRYQQGRAAVALNLLHYRLSLPLLPPLQAYNRFYFRGDRLSGASIDYAYRWHNFSFFGETATDDRGTVATLNGLQLSVDPRLDLAILVRHLPRGFRALTAIPFAAGSGGRNETGVYLGLELRPVRSWTLNAYFDLWRHPWLRFNTRGPTTGYDYRLRLTFVQKRRLRTYLEWRGGRPATTRHEQHRQQLRLHLAPQITKALELRSRLDIGAFRNDQGASTIRGFCLLQDVIFRPIGFPLAFTARYAIFDTGGYDLRFYHYENNLLFLSSVPAYYDQGTRWYINLRYRPVLPMTIELRLAQSRWHGTIKKSPRTQVSLQLRYQIKSGL